MLNIFRRHASGFFAKIILALLILSFAVWGIGDMLNPNPMGKEIARVGKVKITRLDVEREMQQDIAQLRERLGANYKPEIVKMINLPAQVVQRMVSQQLIKQEIADLGIRVGDPIVAELIRSNKAFADESGAFKKEHFHAVLKQNNLSEQDYTSRVKQDMATRLISQTVVGYGEIPDIAVNVMLAAQKEKRKVNVYQVNVNDVEVPEPSEEELNEYFKSVSHRYATPEFRSVSYVEMDESQLGDIQISEEELQQAYTERKEEYSTPEFRSFEQLLYTGKDQAEKAAEQLRSGKTIAEVAAALPPLNAGNTAIKQVSEKALPEQIRAQAFALKDGEISAPIQSSFGFHVLKLTKVEPARTRDFEEVKAALEKDLKPTKINDALTAKANKLEDLMAGGATLADAAADMGLKVKRLEDFNEAGKTISGAAAPIPTLNNFVKVAFATEEQSDSTVNVGRPGVYYLVHVDKVTPEKLPPIDTIKTELVKSWKTSRTGTLEKARADEIAGKISDQKQREEVLRSAAVKPYTSGEIARQNINLNGKDLPATLVQEVFTTSIGDTTGAHQLQNGAYVLAIVASSSMPDLIEADELVKNKEANTLRQSMRNNMQQELMEEYMQSLTKKYQVKINEEALAAIGVEQ